jgi:hypothetical protein
MHDFTPLFLTAAALLALMAIMTILGCFTAHAIYMLSTITVFWTNYLSLHDWTHTMGMTLATIMIVPYPLCLCLGILWGQYLNIIDYASEKYEFEESFRLRRQRNYGTQDF